MRKLILFEHISLDGYMGRSGGAIDWVRLDEGMFDLVKASTDESDTALYGRVTYGMMQAYWPTAASKPNASRHDIDHSAWYKKVEKIVVSRTLKDIKLEKTRFIADNVPEEVSNLKAMPGKNILVFGSPSVGSILMEKNLVDELWLMLNPIILGSGIPLFSWITHTINLQLLDTKVFPVGVIGLHYSVAS